MFTPNRCETCPLTAWTTCAIQSIAYDRGLEGMARCEVREDIERMLRAMKARKNVKVEVAS